MTFWTIVSSFHFFTSNYTSMSFFWLPSYWKKQNLYVIPTSSRSIKIVKTFFHWKKVIALFFKEGRGNVTFHNSPTRNDCTKRNHITKKRHDRSFECPSIDPSTTWQSTKKWPYYLETFNKNRKTKPERRNKPELDLNMSKREGHPLLIYVWSNPSFIHVI